tara:strand:- start:1733 stop:2566 length:834 start_codon:yes stop_codon:yes gene_type:complete
MAIFNYTAAKGVFETVDSNTTGAFNVSDVGVVGEAAPVGAINVKRIRIYDQANSDGDDYAGLDEQTFTITAEGVSTTFELDTAGDYAGADTQIDLSGVNTNNLAGATPKQVTDAIVAVINSTLATVEAVAQAEVGSSNDKTDYSDFYIYNRQPGVAFTLSSSSATALSVDTVQAAQSSATLRSIDGGAVLEANRTEDTVAIDTGLGGIQLGALSDGTRVGQMICMFNNSTNLRMFFTGNFTGGTDTAMVDHGEGSILVWDGSDWDQWKYYGGQITFS